MGNNVVQSVSMIRNEWLTIWFILNVDLYLILKHNRVVDAISDLPWYFLPINSQKDISHILNRAQHGTVLRIGPFDRLDYETATNVSKKLLNLNIVNTKFC